MAKRGQQRDPGTQGGSQPGSARSRQRGKPVQVQPKTPWGAIVGGSVLGLLLIGVVVYAVLNSGSGFKDPLAKADSAVKGVAIAKGTLSRNHVTGTVDYPQRPPNGGDHNATPQTCAVYDAPIADEHAVHSLEHGAVWITYQPSLPADQVAALRKVATGKSYVLMSPYPSQSAPIDLSAWGRRLSVQKASDPRVEEFVETYANGPQTPERGALCQGTSATGSLASQGAAANPSPMPQSGGSTPAG